MSAIEFNPTPQPDYDGLLFQFRALCGLYNSTRDQCFFMAKTICDLNKRITDGALGSVESQRKANAVLTDEIERLSKSVALEKWHKDIAEAALLSVEKERDTLQARVAELEAICENVPEGCTPADARVLREANHALAAEVAQAKWHKDIAEGALASVEQERDELRRQNGELLAESATHVGSGNRAVRRIKAEAVREAIAAVDTLDISGMLPSHKVGFCACIDELEKYANQIEGGEL